MLMTHPKNRFGASRPFGIVFLASAIPIFCSIAVCLAYSIFFTPHIAYVQSGKLVEGFTETTKVRNQIETEKSKWNAELKALDDSLTASVDRMKTQYDRSSKKKQDTLKLSVDKWNSDLARYTQAVNERKRTRENELMKPVVEKIDSYLAIWGKKRHYSMIFGTQTGGVIVHGDSRFDVTDNVLKDINAYYAK